MSDTFIDKAREIVEIVRDFEQGDGRAPTPEDVAEASGRSLEEIHFILHRLAQHGVLAVIPSAYEDRYAVEDEDQLFTMPTPEEEPSFDEAHKERRAKIDEQVGQIGRKFQAGYVDEEKMKTFSDIQTRLGGGGEKKPNPLDGRPAQVAPAAKPEQKDLFAKLSEQLSGKKEVKPNPLDALKKKP
jgi:hypothetical protein